jgi:DNA-binding MarR family transcriptional regulator
VTVRQVDVQNDGNRPEFPLGNPESTRQEAMEDAYNTLLQAKSVLSLMVRGALEDSKLRPNHLIVLRTLLRDGRSYPAEIAREMTLTRPAVRKLVNKLEAQGLLTRTRRRGGGIVHLELTPKADGQLQTFTSAVRRQLRIAFDGLDSIEVSELQVLLDRLRGRSTDQQTQPCRSC